MYKGERFNGITHLVGAGFAIAGLPILLLSGNAIDDVWKIVSFSVYGAFLILLYLISTLYHSTKGQAKRIFQKLDHIAIYLLIAGTYTPLTLITLRGALGWTIFGISWGLAIIGIAQELIIGKKTRTYSMLIYIVMGWLILAAIVPLYKALVLPGFVLLALGGLLYTFGIIFFVLDEKLKHAHGVWHLFVMGGSIAQYLCLFYYVA